MDKHNLFYCNHRAEKIPSNDALGGHYKKEVINYINRRTKTVWITIFNDLRQTANAPYLFDI